MYSARIEDSFAAAHFLKNYHGKCENLHGHNYRVRVTVKGKNLDEGGMLVDFAVLKKSLKTVLDEVDHTNLNDHPFFGKGDPSAERIAFFIFDRLRMGLPGIYIANIEVFETEKNVASYSPD